MERTLRIGTRGSGLALSQAGWVADRLAEFGVATVIETISTRGDQVRDLPLTVLGGDGVFVRELERALLEDRVDVAVHSLKDLPTAAVEGLEIACVPERATPFDAFVGRPGESLASLPAGALVGTSSIRRVVQVRAVRPDLEVRPIRGNVDTRLGKLDAGEYHCLVLAAAGLERLGLGHRIGGLLEPPDFWPAVGQGALAIQVRAGDEAVRRAIVPLDHAATHAAVRAERACLAGLSAGCLAPVGAWGRVEPGGDLVLAGRVLDEHDGRIGQVTVEERVVGFGRLEDGTTASVALGKSVAEGLMAAGAGPMLERMRQRLI
ncbi:MAG: hydroxymethylbilane synthase [Planctomycetota bacterium]